MPHIQHQGDNSSTSHAIKRHRSYVDAPSRRFVASRKLPLLPRSPKSRGTARPHCRRIIKCWLGLFRRWSYLGDRCLDWRRGLASTAMTVIPNDARLLGPADPHVSMSTRPPRCGIGCANREKPRAQLKAAVAAVGPRSRTCANTCNGAGSMGCRDDAHPPTAR